MGKEAYFYGKATYVYGKRGLFTGKRSLLTQIATHTTDLLLWEKRPTLIGKEAYPLGKEAYSHKQRHTQVDAEGYDARIIEQLDIGYWAPRVVSLEAINLPRNELLQVRGFRV